MGGKHIEACARQRELMTRCKPRCSCWQARSCVLIGVGVAMLFAFANPLLSKLAGWVPRKLRLAITVRAQGGTGTRALIDKVDERLTVQFPD